MNLTDIQARLAAFSNPAFTFDQNAHEYFLGERKLLSFSTWIKDFLAPFDELQVAGFSASKRGCTVQEVLAEWEWARQLGTEVHAYIEQWYKQPVSPSGERFLTLPANGEVRARCQKFLALHKKRLQELTPLAMELKVFNEAAGLCGTIDHVASHPDRRGVIPLDFKTNKEITRVAGRFTKRMRGALCDLFDTHLVKYSLQLSYYRVMLEEAGIYTESGALIWLPPGDVPAEVIPALDFRQRIRSLLFN